MRDGVAPPESRYPRIDDGTLVPLAALAFPAHPRASRRRRARTTRIGWTTGRAGTRASSRPGAARRRAPVPVPSCRRSTPTATTIAGVRIPEMLAPARDVHGLEPARPGDRLRRSARQLRRLLRPASPRTRADRERTGDPRVSLEERYGSPRALPRTLRRGGAPADPRPLPVARRPGRRARARPGGVGRRDEVRRGRARAVP